MTMMGSMTSGHFSCSTAAAAVSACNMPVLDTAMELVVSICVPVPARICRTGA